MVATLASQVHAPAVSLQNLDGIENVGRVAPGIYRGGAPTQEGIETLRRMGVRTIVNLRHYHGRAEEQACRERGLRYVGIRLESSDPPSDSDIARFLSIVTDTRQQPVYFHCWRGKDRTGMMCAIYRMAVEDWSLEEALAEMDAYGFFRGWRDLRRAVKDFSPRRDRFRSVAKRTRRKH